MRVLILYPGLYEERRALLAPHKWRLRITGTHFVLAESRLHPEDAQVFGEAIQLPPPADADKVWDVLVRYLERHPVDAIVAQSEPGLLIGARLAREFGLPGPTVEAAMATVNKHQTRTLLDAAGIAQPAFQLVSTAAEVRAFGAAHGWPVVLKATASARQRLVARVASPEDADAAVQTMLAGLPSARDVLRMASFAKLEGLDLGFDPFEHFLVESFQSGQALECDGMLSAAEPHWFGVCEQIPSSTQGFFIEGYLLPARLDEARRREVIDVAAGAVRALGLTNTGVSAELHLDDDGPHIIEINGRLPWDEGLQELVEAATGCFPALLALRVAMGKKIRRARHRRFASLLYRPNYIAGTVRRVPSPAEWKRMTKGARAAWLYISEGAQLLHGDHPDSRPHLAGVLTTDRHSTERARERGAGILDSLSIDID